LFKGEGKISYIENDDIIRILGANLLNIIKMRDKIMMKKKEKTFDDFEKCPPIKDMIVLKELGAG